MRVCAVLVIINVGAFVIRIGSWGFLITMLVDYTPSLGRDWAMRWNAIRRHRTHLR